MNPGRSNETSLEKVPREFRRETWFRFEESDRKLLFHDWDRRVVGHD